MTTQQLCTCTGEQAANMPRPLATLEQCVRETGVYRCLDCGKCTAICPISHYDRRFSPRRTVGRALLRHDGALLTDDRLWTCLTCLQCSQVCPAGVDYPNLTLAIRTEARQLGAATVCTHGEAIHAWMRMMMDPGLKQDRLGWLTAEAGSEDRKGKNVTRITHHASRITHHEVRTSNDSDTLYFVGCAPYYGALFKPLGVDGDGIARATVRILNVLGIEPKVLADERCCGHDLLWEGDVEGFRTLAELNATLIRRAGVKRIITACPECARALKLDYPAHGIELGVEVMHLAELLAGSKWQVTGDREQGAGRREQGAGDRRKEMQRNTQHATERSLPVGRITHHSSRNTQQSEAVLWDASRLTPHASRVTYHDPCRLGRHLGVYDAPRRVIEGLGLELVEMPRHRQNALCCGTNGWTHCAVANKAIQVDRLGEARSTGAELLVTACIKCQIHFKCAMQDRLLQDEIAIEIKDLATLVAEALD